MDFINQDPAAGEDLSNLLGDASGVIKQEGNDSLLLGSTEDYLGLGASELLNFANLHNDASNTPTPPAYSQASPTVPQQQITLQSSPTVTTQSILQQELALAAPMVIKSETVKNSPPLTTLISPLPVQNTGVTANKNRTKARYIQLHSQLAEHIAAGQAQQQRQQQPQQVTTTTATVQQLQQLLQQQQQPLQIQLTTTQPHTEPKAAAPKIIVQQLQQPISLPQVTQPQQIIISAPQNPPATPAISQLSLQQLQQVNHPVTI